MAFVHLNDAEPNYLLIALDELIKFTSFSVSGRCHAIDPCKQISARSQRCFIICLFIFLVFLTKCNQNLITQPHPFTFLF